MTSQYNLITGILEKCLYPTNDDDLEPVFIGLSDSNMKQFLYKFVLAWTCSFSSMNLNGTTHQEVLDAGHGVVSQIFWKDWVDIFQSKILQKPTTAKNKVSLSILRGLFQTEKKLVEGEGRGLGEGRGAG